MGSKSLLVLELKIPCMGYLIFLVKTINGNYLGSYYGDGYMDRKRISADIRGTSIADGIIYIMEFI